jgi:hypothetical protein
MLNSDVTYSPYVNFIIFIILITIAGSNVCIYIIIYYHVSVSSHCQKYSILVGQ